VNSFIFASHIDVKCTRLIRMPLIHHSVIEEDRSCTVSVTPSPLHIAKPSVSSSRSVTASLQTNIGPLCGTITHPWLLEAPAGQRIRTSLIDFTPTTSEDSAMNDRALAKSRHVGEGCDNQQQKHPYGFVIDKSAAEISRRNVSICATVSSQRLATVHLSSSNTVQLQILSNEQQLILGQQNSFLIKIEGMYSMCTIKLSMQIEANKLRWRQSTLLYSLLPLTACSNWDTSWGIGKLCTTANCLASYSNQHLQRS